MTNQESAQFILTYLNPMADKWEWRAVSDDREVGMLNSAGPFDTAELAVAEALKQYPDARVGA